MSRHDIDPFARWEQAARALSRPGLLLGVVRADGTPNVMTIGWANTGVLWSRPVCIVYVRPSRYSYTCLEEVPEFTVNVPKPDMARAVGICGTKSGRDGDKFAAAGLTAGTARHVKAPIVEPGVLHYECRVVHYNDVIPEQLDKNIIDEFYPQGDFHRVYFGEILACYEG